MKILWLDTETTGVNRSVDEILTMAGCIQDSETHEIHEWFDFKIQPTDVAKISDGAIAVHGISREVALTYATPTDVVVQFREILERWNPATKAKWTKGKNHKYVVAGYNTNFDIDMLKGFFDRHSAKSLHQYISFMKIDVYQTVQEMYLEGHFRDCTKHNLGAICEVYGIELDAHDALNDIKATMELREKLK